MRDIQLFQTCNFPFIFANPYYQNMCIDPGISFWLRLDKQKHMVNTSQYCCFWFPLIFVFSAYSTNSSWIRFHPLSDGPMTGTRHDAVGNRHEYIYVYVYINKYLYIYIYIYLLIYETCAWTPNNVFWALMFVESLLCNTHRKSKHSCACSAN